MSTSKKDTKRKSTQKVGAFIRGVANELSTNNKIQLDKTEALQELNVTLSSSSMAQKPINQTKPKPQIPTLKMTNLNQKVTSANTTTFKSVRTENYLNSTQTKKVIDRKQILNSTLLNQTKVVEASAKKIKKPMPTSQYQVKKIE